MTGSRERELVWMEYAVYHVSIRSSLKKCLAFQKEFLKKSLTLIGFFQGNNVICPSFSSSGSRHLNPSDA